MNKHTEITVSSKLVKGRQLVMFPHFDYIHGASILFLFYQLFLVLSYFKFLLYIR